jgi:hypothetical protein
MARNDHFKAVVDWSAAAKLVDFEPRRPKNVVAVDAEFGTNSSPLRVSNSRFKALLLKTHPDAMSLIASGEPSLTSA